MSKVINGGKRCLLSHTDKQLQKLGIKYEVVIFKGSGGGPEIYALFYKLSNAKEIYNRIENPIEEMK